MSYLQGETRLANARLWHQISAKNCILGRLATDVGDYVIVTNCALLRLDERKLNRTYVRHTGRPGGLKKWTMKQWIEREGVSAVVRHAVSGMLPKNRLRDRRLDRLKCFEGESHPYYKNIQRVWTGSGKWLSTPISL